MARAEPACRKFESAKKKLTANGYWLIALKKMHVLLFDDPAIRPHLLPFTFTRPVAALRCGILTLAEKWQHRLGVASVGYLLGYSPPLLVTVKQCRASQKSERGEM